MSYEEYFNHCSLFKTDWNTVMPSLHPYTCTPIPQPSCMALFNLVPFFLPTLHQPTLILITLPHSFFLVSSHHVPPRPTLHITPHPNFCPTSLLTYSCPTSLHTYILLHLTSPHLTSPHHHYHPPRHEPQTQPNTE
ncbi:hypothetical protein Pmani_018484 [Petrolisthes manimaculis]|uniref:Uncharacterized protein n=1 Tax=Petrolisthes manimaculis TaxID=1843537 RepID=A0AAE1PK89_9EUCA|nr:hypothetical protein Pmani_018484 [Petrolisthes manimaculis]